MDNRMKKRRSIDSIDETKDKHKFTIRLPSELVEKIRGSGRSISKLISFALKENYYK